jgi:hypothetical protein
MADRVCTKARRIYSKPFCHCQGHCQVDPNPGRACADSMSKCNNDANVDVCGRRKRHASCKPFWGLREAIHIYVHSWTQECRYKPMEFPGKAQTKWHPKKHKAPYYKPYILLLFEGPKRHSVALQCGARIQDPALCPHKLLNFQHETVISLFGKGLPT